MRVIPAIFENGVMTSPFGWPDVEGACCVVVIFPSPASEIEEFQPFSGSELEIPTMAALETQTGPSAMSSKDKLVLVRAQILSDVATLLDFDYDEAARQLVEFHEIDLNSEVDALAFAQLSAHHETIREMADSLWD